MSEDEKITLKAERVMSTAITVYRGEYEQAKRDEQVDHLLDVELSDMDGETWITEPDGSRFNPHTLQSLPPPADEQELPPMGRLAFEQWTESMEGMMPTFGGRQGIPPWDALDEKQQHAWDQAARRLYVLGFTAGSKA